MIDFSLLTLATPEPYDPKEPNRQRENFYFGLNQILSQLKADGATFDLHEITQAVQDLSFSGGTVEVGGLRIERSGKLTTLHNT